jgi:hypothetical protein
VEYRQINVSEGLVKDLSNPKTLLRRIPLPDLISHTQFAFKSFLSYRIRCSDKYHIDMYTDQVDYELRFNSYSHNRRVFKNQSRVAYIISLFKRGRY